ncbi:hypothetical protein EBZ38_04195 [bacterium]|nr:hypothetical protein [bacterium]NDD83469.1 hypothetical protein [bacterium]
MKLTQSNIKKILYIACLVSIVFLIKPSLAFKPNGTHREYGLGVDKEGYKRSIYTMPVFVVVIVVLVNKFVS